MMKLNISLFLLSLTFIVANTTLSGGFFGDNIGLRTLNRKTTKLSTITPLRSTKPGRIEERRRRRTKNLEEQQGRSENLGRYLPY